MQLLFYNFDVDAFRNSSLYGINMDFWICMAIIFLIVIIMNIVFWSAKPKLN